MPEGRHTFPQDLAGAVFQTSEFKPKLFALRGFSGEACGGSGAGRRGWTSRK